MKYLLRGEIGTVITYTEDTKLRSYTVLDSRGNGPTEYSIYSGRFSEVLNRAYRSGLMTPTRENIYHAIGESNHNRLISIQNSKMVWTASGLFHLKTPVQIRAQINLRGPG